jgi:hypothetical protein
LFISTEATLVGGQNGWNRKGRKENTKENTSVNLRPLGGKN